VESAPLGQLLVLLERSEAAIVLGPMIPSMGPEFLPLSWSAFWTALTCSEPGPWSMSMPDFGVPAAVPAPEDGMLLPVPGVLVPD
jgi:hypothetical protein